MAWSERYSHAIRIIAGSIIAAFSMRLFIIPNGLLAGGVSGLALILHYLTGVEVSLLIILINIPIFIVGWFQLHRGYMLRSILGVSGFTLFLKLFSGLPPQVFPDELILPALFGGFINGIGFGLIFRGRGSTGGNDIISLILNRRYSFGVGSLNLAFNVIVLVSGIFIYDFRLVGYTLISMFVTGMVIDRVQLGLNRGMWVMIVSQSADQIQEAIIHRLRRGVTILHGEGGYTHNALKIVITTVSRTQLAKLKDIVAEIDEKAFVTVHETAEVLGRGFPRQLEKTQTAQRS